MRWRRREANLSPTYYNLRHSSPYTALTSRRLGSCTRLYTPRRRRSVALSTARLTQISFTVCYGRVSLPSSRLHKISNSVGRLTKIGYSAFMGRVSLIKRAIRWARLTLDSASCIRLNAVDAKRASCKAARGGNRSSEQRMSRSGAPHERNAVEPTPLYIRIAAGARSENLLKNYGGH